MNTHSQLTLARLRRAKQNRFNPLPAVTDPTQVARKIDSFEAGYLKEAVNIFDALEQREDLIRAVISKRKKAVGRESWTVLIDSNTPSSLHSEAQQHAAALEYFYQNLRCENALDSAEKGGFKLLCRQMMDAIGKRFAVHEIVWNMSAKSQLSAVKKSPPAAKHRNSQCKIENARCSMLNENSSSQCPGNSPHQE